MDSPNNNSNDEPKDKISEICLESEEMIHLIEASELSDSTNLSDDNHCLDIGEAKDDDINCTMTKVPITTYTDDISRLEDVSLISFVSCFTQAGDDLELKNETDIEDLKEIRHLQVLVEKQKQDQELLLLQLDEEKAKVEQLTVKDEQLMQLLNEFERDLTRYFTKSELEKQKLIEQAQTAMLEHDLFIQHIFELEDAYSNVHRKYERSRVVIGQLKMNEEILKVNNGILRILVNEKDGHYNALKDHATSQLDKANAERQSLLEQHATQISKLKTLLEKDQAEINSLQEQYDQKVEECDQLMDMCTLLIDKFD